MSSRPLPRDAGRDQEVAACVESLLATNREAFTQEAALTVAFRHAPVWPEGHFVFARSIPSACSCGVEAPSPAGGPDHAFWHTTHRRDVARQLQAEHDAELEAREVESAARFTEWARSSALLPASAASRWRPDARALASGATGAFVVLVVAAIRESWRLRHG